MSLRHALVLGLGLAMPVVSAEARAEGLPQALTCQFQQGASSSYEAGAFKSTVSQPLSFNIVAIDLEAQKAEFALPDSKTGKLSVVRALNATHFIEVLVEGFMTVTTVYDFDAAKGVYPAVHSRHMGILGAPLVAQYTGACWGSNP